MRTAVVLVLVLGAFAACTGDDGGDGGDDGDGDGTDADGDGDGDGDGTPTMMTLGADLSQTPDITNTCSQASQGSCTLYSGTPGPSFYAPASGTVKKVRVKTAPGPTGPMQIVVLRSLYQNNLGDPGHPFFACCFVEAYGPTFTPTAGGITEVDANLPMIVDPIPPPDDGVTNARGDFLALSILAPNVAIPAITDQVGSVWVLYAPAPMPGSPPAPSPNALDTVNNSGFGVHLMMNADIEL